MDAILAAVRDKQYIHVTRQCRELEIPVRTSDQNPLFYAVYLLGYLLQNDLYTPGTLVNPRPNARAVYSRTPSLIQNTLVIKFLHSLLQRAWSRDYTGFYILLSQLETGLVQIDEPVHSLILEYKRSWQARTLTLLTKAYTSITPEKAAEYLGLSSDVIVQTLQQEKWTFDADKNLLIPGKVEQPRKENRNEAEFADFARLTEIAMVLKGK